MNKNLIFAFIFSFLILIGTAFADFFPNRVASTAEDNDGTPNATIIANIIGLDGTRETFSLQYSPFGWLNATQFNATIPTGSTLINLTIQVSWINTVRSQPGANKQNVSFYNTTNWVRCAGPFPYTTTLTNTTCFFTGSNLTGNFTTIDAVNSMTVNFTGVDNNSKSIDQAEIDVINITVYFTPPAADPSFNIAFPTSYSGSFNETINSACSSENACPTVNNITFNFTGLYENFVQPMTNGQSANQQAGPSKPIFLIYNTGNVAEVIGINTSTPSGIFTCVNSSCVGGECSGTVSTCTNISSPGYLSLGTLNQGKRMNITLYANVTYAAAGTSETYTYMNATG